MTSDDLPIHLMQPQPSPGDETILPDNGLQLEPYLDDVRRQLMSQALERCSGTQTQAAELLGMTFRSFRYYAKKMGLTGIDDETIPIPD